MEKKQKNHEQDKKRKQKIKREEEWERSCLEGTL
jgi:hypothetical protein